MSPQIHSKITKCICHPSLPYSCVEVREVKNGAQLQCVLIRCPAFNAERPALWFAQLEGQFHLSGINDEVTRDYYASSHLDPKAAAEVQDILLNVPAETPYTGLKEALIVRLTLSRDARLQQLLNREVLDDRKLSQFLRHLRSLDDTVPDNILRTKWLSRLPMTTQSILASQADIALDRLATLADKLHEIALPVAHFNDVQEPTSSALETRFSHLEATICEVVSALKGQSVARSRSHSRSRSRATSHPITTSAVLQQRRGQHWEPLGFFSQKLQPALRKHCPYDRELHAIYAAVRKFRYIFEARHVMIFTDHKPLLHAFAQDSDRVTPWQFYRLDFIGQYSTDIQYVAGKDNVVTDVLSRIEAISAGVSTNDLAEAQAAEGEL
ncbi:uncharacterized protein LOC107045898 [Diachasma alloeum]|uniref:uncharacterized protein LOC107045898 n=1 Tax=Diachasma alloeum TaxID=454923 RepID=UPI000738153F|nr:uncharacterized protein LOC107045898 [Diachasma alloeum]